MRNTLFFPLRMQMLLIAGLALGKMGYAQIQNPFWGWIHHDTKEWMYEDYTNPGTISQQNTGMLVSGGYEKPFWSGGFQMSNYGIDYYFMDRVATNMIADPCGNMQFYSTPAFLQAMNGSSGYTALNPTRVWNDPRQPPFTLPLYEYEIGSGTELCIAPRPGHEGEYYVFYPFVKMEKDIYNQEEPHRSAYLDVRFVVWSTITNQLVTPYLAGSSSTSFPACNMLAEATLNNMGPGNSFNPDQLLLTTFSTQSIARPRETAFANGQAIMAASREWPMQGELPRHRNFYYVDYGNDVYLARLTDQNTASSYGVYRSPYALYTNLAFPTVNNLAPELELWESPDDENDFKLVWASSEGFSDNFDPKPTFLHMYSSTGYSFFDCGSNLGFTNITGIEISADGNYVAVTAQTSWGLDGIWTFDITGDYDWSSPVFQPIYGTEDYAQS